MIDNGRKLSYFAGFMKFWKTIIAVAAACFAGGFCETMAQEITEPEMLEIRYTKHGTSSYTNHVAKDVEQLFFDPYTTALHLPEGLTKLHTLSTSGVGDSTPQHLTRLILPKDIGKDADWPFRLLLARLPIDFTLQVHKDMGQFSLWILKNASSQFDLPVRIPSAKNLIRNREPDDDGVFRILMHQKPAYESDKFTIEVHGVEPQIWLNRQEGGVEIVWDRGQLQSAPSIDGPWTDITFDDTRRLFLRSSSPAEFFRVKP